jgi:hypothetical protein
MLVIILLFAIYHCLLEGSRRISLETTREPRHLLLQQVLQSLPHSLALFGVLDFEIQRD